MMTDSVSFATDPGMPEYRPMLELIPSFKLIRRKSLLSEFRVGRGRLMLCGLRLTADDPAAKWMKHLLLDYLVQGEYAPAPEWPPEDLRSRLNARPQAAASGKKIDAGGRPVG